MNDQDTTKVTVRSLLVGALFAALFAMVTVYFENRKATYLTATQIAPAPYFLLFLMVFCINPFCRFLRVVRRFTVTEVLVVFMMGSVSAGISTYGLASQLVPVVSSLFNEHWNNDQTEWNIYVEPFVNEAFFLSGDGIRPAACEYRDALMEQRELQRIYDAALRCEKANEALATAEEKRAGFAAETTSGDAARIAESVEAARRAHGEAVQHWEELTRERELPGTDDVVATFTARIDEQKATVAREREELKALETEAFKRVDLFRRGLPDELRAFPGFVPLKGENFTIYVNRVRRLRDGTRAHGHLAKVVAVLRDLEKSDVAGWQPPVASLQRAVGLLEPLADASAALGHKEEVDGDWDALNEERLAAKSELGTARQERRDANAEEFGRLDRKIGKLQRKVKRLADDLKDLDIAKEQLQRQIDIAGRVKATVEKLEDAEERLQSVASDHARAGPAAADLEAVMASFNTIDASWRRFLISDVPWSHWAKPLFLWSIVVMLTYVVLMSFNVLIFRQWAYNERLIYPLAELTEVMAGHTQSGDADGLIPPVFKSGLFWTGFAISASFLGWNLICALNIAPGLKSLDFQNSWTDYINESILQGLIPSARSSVFFTLIGVAFLIPANISFSLWFFWILYMLQLLILVWSGYGVNENSFPVEWWYTLNFRTAEGGGALMVFALVVLYKCRKYLLCAFFPKTLDGLETPEQTELRVSSFAFVFGSIGLILMLWLGLGANVYYTLLVYFIVMMLTIGLVRAVAEGGILGFQAWVSPFHFIRTLFGMDKAWTSPSLYAPLMIFYSFLFLDLKTFIAPAMANAIKIRADCKMKRARFHFAIFFGIVAALAASMAVHIMMGYNRGGDSMNGWFYSSFPKLLFNRIASMTKTTPVDNTGCAMWFFFGVALMTGLLYFRQLVFWLPHPIGLIMLVNPLMRTYWFSVFLGWVAKSLVTKYGNKDTYAHVRQFFIGLIFGELALVVIATIVSYLTDTSIPINLNRN